MKKLFLLLLIATVAFGAETRFQNGIIASSPSAIGGTSSANSCSMLDINSTTQGFNAPRMTTTQMNAISSPNDGLMIYNTTAHAPFAYENGSWTQIGGTLPTDLAYVDENNTFTGENTFSNQLNSSLYAVSLTNDGTTGTALHHLVSLTSAVEAVTATAGATSGVIGVALDGTGTSGTVNVAYYGFSSCQFDGSTNAGDYVQLSASVNGDCTDVGSSFPANGAQVLGQVLAHHTGASAQQVFFFNLSLSGGAGSYTFPDSVALNAGAVTLKNDASSGTSEYYGFDASSSLGYHSWPTFNQSTTGNAATCTEFQSAPTGCGAGQVPTGISQNGDATGCAYPTISMTNAVGSQTASPSSITVPNNQLTGNGIGSALIETGNKNLLANPNFEASTTDLDWTIAGSGVSASTDTSNFHEGLKSLKLTFSSFSASTLVASQSITPGATMSTTNGEAGLWVETTQANLQVCALAAGSVISGTCNNVPATGNWVYVPANFVFPSSGSSGVGLYASASISSGTANIDEGYLGEARNIGTVAQAQWVGRITNSGCAWSISSPTTSLANFGTQSGCSYSVSGSVTAPSTNIPGFQLSGAPGNYLLIAGGQFGNNVASTTTATYFGFSDGTNTTSKLNLTADTATGIFGPNLSGSLTETSAFSNLTFQLQGAGSTTSAQPYASNFTIDVYYYPTQTQQVASLSTVSANWSGLSSMSGSTASGTIGAISLSIGSVTALGSPQGISCTADATYVGIDCTLPKVANYLVCYSGVISNGTTGYGSYAELFDSSGTAVVGEQANVQPSGGQPGSIGSCGIYTAPSTSVKFYAEAAVNGGGTTTIGPKSFSITQITSPGPQPYATGNVSSKGSAQYGAEYAAIDCSSSSSIVGNNSGFIASIGNVSSGCCALTLNSGVFSSVPRCVVTGESSTQTNFNMNTYTTSSTAVSVCAGIGGSAASNFVANIICMGPK